jgi:Zn-dependent peptidase ImmA (M78 family)
MSVSLRRYLITRTARHAAQVRLREAPARSIPVDLAVLSDFWHVTWHLAVLHDVPGFSFYDDDGNPQIVLNQAQDPRIQRFTWAHELGHIVFCHPFFPYTAWRNTQDWVTTLLEIEANAFAAECLIPHDWLMTQLAPYGLPPWNHAVKRAIFRDNVPQWAQQLNVSPSVVRYTLIDLAGLPPTVKRAPSRHPTLS